jgi:Arc/MetJ family transcription regulator
MNKMRECVEPDENLLREAMIISGANTGKAVVDMALQEFVKTNHRKQILKYKDRGIWEGNLDEMRAMR